MFLVLISDNVQYLCEHKVIPGFSDADLLILNSDKVATRV